jgi:hypothetical protein
MIARPWVVLGNVENRRVAFFQAALASRGESPAQELSYVDLLTNRRPLDELLPAGALLRIESPGENFAVEKLLLVAGEEAAANEGGSVLSRRSIDRLADDPGRLLYPRQWYLGYRQLLLQLDRELKARPDVTVLSDPHDIALMFDKPRCYQRCAELEVPLPSALASVGSFEDLADRMRHQGLRRVMLKLAHGSSASGVVALHRRGDRWEAITSTEMVGIEGETRLYNSLKICRYTAIGEIETLVNALLPHRVHLEEWLPKASIAGHVFDLRILVIGGDAQHSVVRMSRHPMTNLHLGNRRGDPEQALAKLSDDQRTSLRETCRRAAAACRKSIHVGLDVLFTPGLRRHYVLELNAFGDLLPRVLHNGRTTYEAEIDAIAIATTKTIVNQV